MEQSEFIWFCRNLRSDKVTQDPNGSTIVELRPGIRISHNYKKNNSMILTFTEDQSKFKIPSKVELESIFRLHLMNDDLTHILREHCVANLENV